MKKNLLVTVLYCLFLAAGLLATRIMIVQSYDEGYKWSRELLEGVQSALASEQIEWKVFYMDTRLRTSEEWKTKAGQIAAEQAEYFQPDIIIAIDDNAQEYFAKDLTTVPVVFCGVNEDPAIYSYPRQNVAGVQEKLFSEQTVSMIKELFYDTEHIHFIGDMSETTFGMKKQLEATAFEGVLVGIHVAGTFSQWKDIVESLSYENLAIVILANRTLKDEHGNTVDSSSVTRWTVENSRVPVFSILDFVVEDGAIGGVVNSGFDEGFQAGVIASRILHGEPPANIGVEESMKGSVMLNVDAALSKGVILSQEWMERIDRLVSTWPFSTDTVLSLMVNSFEERVFGIITSLRILAGTPQVMSGEWSQMQPLLKRFNDSYEGLAMYILLNGDYYSVQRGWTGLNLSDRGYFPVLQDGGEVMGYQVMSRSTGKRSVVFAVPVPSSGEIAGYVGLSAFFEEWNSRLTELFGQTSELHFYAFDAQNTLALTDEYPLLLGSLEVPVDGLSERIDSLEGERGSFLYVSAGTMRLAEYRRSPSTGWIFMVTRKLEHDDNGIQMRLLIDNVQREIQVFLNRLDSALYKGAEDIVALLDTPAEIRPLLRELYESNPEIVNTSFIDKESVIRYIYPDEYSYVEGEWIGDQEQVQRLHETRMPVLSGNFLAVEGFHAADLEWPVFRKDGSLAGSLSFLIKPDLFLAPIILPHNKEPYEFWIMDPDGTILYDQDIIEIGRNLFDDPLYKAFDSLIEIGYEIVAKESGEGYYTFYSKGMENLVNKEVIWTSVGLHGTQWRIVLTKILD